MTQEKCEICNRSWVVMLTLQQDENLSVHNVRPYLHQKLFENSNRESLTLCYECLLNVFYHTIKEFELDDKVEKIITSVRVAYEDDRKHAATYCHAFKYPRTKNDVGYCNGNGNFMCRECGHFNMDSLKEEDNTKTDVKNK